MKENNEGEIIDICSAINDWKINGVLVRRTTKIWERGKEKNGCEKMCKRKNRLCKYPKRMVESNFFQWKWIIKENVKETKVIKEEMKNENVEKKKKIKERKRMKIRKKKYR